MISAYLAGISSQYEGEDIEVRYSINRGEQLLSRGSKLFDYIKPTLVGQFALTTLAKELEEYPDEEIQIIINDAALYEVVRGTSTTQKKDVIKLANDTRATLDKLGKYKIMDVSQNHIELAKWNQVLSF
ncbi:MAG: hypothetical protein HGA27_02120 [Peptococcaceae bacterium]|nr:hypothetical protein [Peptococcaceae bacterium]